MDRDADITNVRQNIAEINKARRGVVPVTGCGAFAFAAPQGRGVQGRSHKREAAQGGRDGAGRCDAASAAIKWMKLMKESERV